MSIDRDFALYSIGDVLDALNRLGRSDSAYVAFSELTGLSEDRLFELSEEYSAKEQEQNA